MTANTQPHIYESVEAEALSIILGVIVDGLNAEQKNEIADKVSIVATSSQGKLGVAIHQIGSEILKKEIPYQKSDT